MGLAIVLCELKNNEGIKVGKLNEKFHLNSQEILLSCLAVMFPVDTPPSCQVSPVDGRDSHLNSVDDELSWDPGDKPFHVQGQEQVTEQAGGTSLTETKEEVSNALAMSEVREGSKSRGSSLTECDPVWEAEENEESEVAEEVEEEKEELGKKSLSRDETFDFMETEEEPSDPKLSG